MVKNSGGTAGGYHQNCSVKDREEFPSLIVGRGAVGNPKNRFSKIEVEADLDELD